MQYIRFSLAFLGVALTLIGSLTSIETETYAAVLFVLLVGLSVGQLIRIARFFAGLCLLVSFYALAIDRAAIDISVGAFLFAFLLVSGSLRIAAGNERLIVALGKRFVQIQRNRQFLMVSLGTGLFAVVLLNGALQFVCGIFSAEKSAELSDRLRITRTFISGFALNPILSPIAIPFVVISSMLPSMRWVSVAPYLIFCAALIWVSGWVQISLGIKTAQVNTESKNVEQLEKLSPGEMRTALLLILTPIITTVVLILLAGLEPRYAAFASIFAASLIWPGLRLKQPKLILKGYTVAINEATIIGSSLILGILMLAYIPTAWEAAASQLLFDVGIFVPLAVIGFFAVCGLVGIQPSICFILCYIAVFPYVSVLDDGVAPVYASLIVGWTLNSLVSPLGLPVMVVAQAFNIQPVDFTFKYGWPFLFMSTLGSSAVLILALVLV